MSELREIPLDQIKVMVSRAREKAGWEQLKASMADVGLQSPIQVRDKGRKDADGIRYELIFGEGRVTAALDLGWKTIPAIVAEASNEEFAGRFLAENMIREPLPWATKGRMIRDAIKDGGELSEVCARLHISENLGRKYLRVIEKAAQPDVVERLPVNVAEVLTALPANGQTIVVEVAAEHGADIRELATKAKTLPDGWTKTELKKALTRLDTDLAKARTRVKLMRLHWALGPQNIETLMQNPRFRALVKESGIHVPEL